MSFRPLLVVLLVAPALASAQTFTDVADKLPLFAPPIMDLDGDGRMDLISPGGIALQTDDGFEVHPSRAPEIVVDYDSDDIVEGIELFGTPLIVKYDPAQARFETVQSLDFEGNFLLQGTLWLDHDLDGDLDLFLGNDLGIDKLMYYEAGIFEDRSEILPQLERGTYGTAAADYDRDGDSDIYIGLCAPFPDGSRNMLYRNDGESFAEVGEAAGADDVQPTWGVTWLDFDNDGWLDLATANMVIQDASAYEGLLRNNGDGTFTDVASEAGIAGGIEEDSWSVAAADFDNDGWIDLYVANWNNASSGSEERPRLFRNEGDGTFTDITSAAGVGLEEGAAVSVGDLNSDGWVDILAFGLGGNPAFYLNDGGTNGWLSINLTGVASNRDGVGARVEVVAGDLSMVREITAGDGFMTQNHSLRAHFGLGTAPTADITVRWPSGTVDVIEDVAASQTLTIVEGVGLNDPPAMFALTGPADGTVVPLSEPVTLSWEAATDDGAVTYTVYLARPDGTPDATFETTATEFEVPAAALVAEGTYEWAVMARDAYSARTSLSNASFTNNPNVANEAVPEATELALEIWPNPARKAATVQFELATAETVRVEVVDLLGRRVQRLDLGVRGAGRHDERLDLQALRAGLYLVRVVGARSGSARAALTRIE